MNQSLLKLAKPNLLGQSSPAKTHPKLGLVCITASDRIRYRTITRKRLLQMTLEEQQQRLRSLYQNNLQKLDEALDFCVENQIQLYRLSSKLFPFADTRVGEAVLEELRQDLHRIGTRATQLGIRLVLHPDQFVVLSSDDSLVIENSIKILESHAQILDWLAQPRSHWTVMEIHGGKSNRAERLIRVISELPEAVRSRLALENDEYAYSAAEILDICHQAHIPMVFDAHHHIVSEKLESYEHPSIAEVLTAARSTWPVPEWQLVHISNGESAFNDRHHSNLITVMPSAYRYAPWIEVEAKLKEQAIEKLRAEWMPQS